MFNLGIGELTVIAIILIVAVGPDRLPTLMKTVGKTLRAVRQASRDIRTTVGIDEMMREDVLAPPRPRYQPPPSTVSRTPNAALPKSGEAADAKSPTEPGAGKADGQTAPAGSGADVKSANAAPDGDKAKLAAGVQQRADALLNAAPPPSSPSTPAPPAAPSPAAAPVDSPGPRAESGSPAPAGAPPTPAADEGPKRDG
jgi:sec-independent protein translocase protein TatB